MFSFIFCVNLFNNILCFRPCNMCVCVCVLPAIVLNHKLSCLCIFISLVKISFVSASFFCAYFSVFFLRVLVSGFYFSFLFFVWFFSALPSLTLSRAVHSCVLGPRPRLLAPLEYDALLLAQEHQIIGDHVADMQVNDPVHQIEAHEAHGEHDA